MCYTYRVAEVRVKAIAEFGDPAGNLVKMHLLLLPVALYHKHRGRACALLRSRRVAFALER
jgi:hypothetical protein